MWSLTKGSEGDSFSCIQMMLNPTLSTRLSYLLLLTHNPHLSFAPALVPFFLGDYSAVLPSSVSLILLLYPYLSHFSPLSIGSFPLFHQGHEYISSYPAPSHPPLSQ